MGDSLEYRGPVYDSEKAKFFADVDVFVFLTTYLNEAQPTVLFEAMAYGIPVISCDRGCIRDQVADGGYVFPQRTDHIVTETVEILESFAATSTLSPNEGERHVATSRRSTAVVRDKSSSSSIRSQRMSSSLEEIMNRLAAKSADRSFENF